MSAELDRILQEENLFLILNIGIDATTDEVRSAYKKLVRVSHPDRYQEEELKQKAETAFKRVGVAFDTLQDPLMRKTYERTVERSMRPSSTGASSTTTAPKAPAQAAPAAPPRPQSKKPQAAPAASDEIKREQADKYYQAGKGFDRKNLLEDAIREFKDAIRMVNDVAKYHSSLAHALDRKGWTGYAQAEFKVALHFDPTDRLALKHYIPTAGKQSNKGFKWLAFLKSGDSTRLGDILIKLGHLDKRQLQLALKQQGDEKLLLGEILIRKRFIKPEHLAQALIHQAEALEKQEQEKS